MADFVVAGDRRYGQVVLQADTLWFQKNSRLILAPDKERGSIPTTLTIIAKKIRIDDSAEITYDLDGLPGFDPDTPAPPQMAVAANGPNGGSVPGEGSYPLASNGGDGFPGQTGKKGIAGRHAPELEIFVGDVIQNKSNALRINFKGQDGGRGGRGGDGGNGGDGQKGAASTASDSWYDGDECTREPGRGGNGGKGGNAGYPGMGGAGGNGAIIKVFARSGTPFTAVQGWDYIFKGGLGADPGDPGKKGAGGAGGAQGDKNGPCPTRSEYHGTNGPDGQSMDDIDPNWQTNYRGEDGKDGEVGTYELTGVPS